MKTRGFTAMGTRFARYELTAGEKIERHVHDDDHLTVIATGRIVVRLDDKTIERGPDDAPMLFKAGRHHEVEAMEPCVLLNVFAGGA
jgi:hypothetical protein